MRQSDLLPVAWPQNPELEWCPPGHGDLYTSLAAFGLLSALLAAGMRWCFVSNSNNLGRCPIPASPPGLRPRVCPSRWKQFGAPPRTAKAATSPSTRGGLCCARVRHCHQPAALTRVPDEVTGTAPDGSPAALTVRATFPVEVRLRDTAPWAG